MVDLVDLSRPVVREDENRGGVYPNLGRVQGQFAMSPSLVAPLLTCGIL